MRPKDIVSKAVEMKLFNDRRAGKTPHQTMKSKLSVDVRRKAHASDFVRTGPGLFFLRHLLNGSHAEYEAKPLTKPTRGERVLAFDVGWFPQRLRFQGVTLNWKRHYARLLKPAVCEYLDRMDAECCDTHKQLLTYVMVTRNGSVLAYRRGNYNRVEDFLRGSDCIGFGGHVAEADRTLFTESGMGLLECGARELSEELELPPADKKRLRDGDGLSVIGVLNDDSSGVGRRHLAFVLRYEVSGDRYWASPRRGEKSITRLRWLHPRRKPLAIWHFEYWSQLCLRAFFPRLVRAAPTYRVIRRRPFEQPHILCVLGAVGSGKSEATRILCKDFDYREINTGRLLSGIIKVPPVPQTPRDVFSRKAWAFIQSADGPRRFAQAISHAIRAAQHPRILIDGIRQHSTLDNLRSLTEGSRFGFLFVHTTPDVAYSFYRQREQSDISLPEFLALRGAPVESEVEGMIGLSDAVLYNWTGRTRYHRAIHGLMHAVNQGL
jgi:predicted NUDIX family phosphoesterase